MLEIILILICLAANAVLAGTETAFVALNRQALYGLIKNGDEKARLLLQLREIPERTLSVIQIGITFVGAFAAAIGGAGAEESIVPWIKQTLGLKETFAEIMAIFLVVIPLTFASVVLGELVPKILALRRPLFVARMTAPGLHLISRFLSPIITVFEVSTKKILNLFPKKHTDAEGSGESLPNMLSPLNKQYIMNMVKIEGTRVEEIFLPWDQVVYIEDNKGISEVEMILIRSGHTRVPIVHQGNVLGILNSKEFFAYQKTGKSDWLSLCRSTISIQETTFILTALRSLQQKKAHMAIVYKAQKQTGIVTMEAIFEEIIGDIYDEDDNGAIKEILSKIK